MPADRAREHGALGISTFANHVGQRIAVRDAHDVLLDNRSFVEHARHVVARSADELDAALVRPLVGPCADESRQKRMVETSGNQKLAGKSLRSPTNNKDAVIAFKIRASKRISDGTPPTIT